MGKYLFNPFTKNFTIIPKPQREGFFALSARDGKLEWVVQIPKPPTSGFFALSARDGKMEWAVQKDPMLKTVVIDFSSAAAPFPSTAGILPRVEIARADLSYATSFTNPNLYSYEVLLGKTPLDSTYTVSILLAPDQGAELKMLPSVGVTVSPISSGGQNVAFSYQMIFDANATVNIKVFDLP
jgi:hypothetical protein